MTELDATQTQSPLIEDVYERIAASRSGKVTAVFRAMSASPGALQAISDVGAYFRTRSSLTPLTRECLVLWVASSVGSDYEWHKHWRSAQDLGLDDSAIREMLVSPKGELAAVKQLVGEVVHGPASTEVVAAVRLALGEELVVEVTTMVAYYLGLARVIDVLSVELTDDELTTRMFDTGIGRW